MTRDNMREPAIVCQYCETKTTVDDLLVHIAERCPRRRPPHPRSRWVAWREAMQLGASKASMHRWVSIGYVLVTGEAGDRRYLLRDVVKMIAAQMGGSANGTGESGPAQKRQKRGRKRQGRAWLDPRRSR